MDEALKLLDVYQEQLLTLGASIVVPTVVTLGCLVVAWVILALVVGSIDLIIGIRRGSRLLKPKPKKKTSRRPLSRRMFGDYACDLVGGNLAAIEVQDDATGESWTFPAPDSLMRDIFPDMANRMPPRSTALTRVFGMVGAFFLVFTLAWTYAFIFGASVALSLFIALLLGLLPGLPLGMGIGAISGPKPVWYVRLVDGVPVATNYQNERLEDTPTPEYLADQRRQSWVGEYVSHEEPRRSNLLTYGSMGIAIAACCGILFLFYTHESGSAPLMPTASPTPAVERQVDELFGTTPVPDQARSQ